MRKYVSEFVGTAVPVVLGCGTAMLVGCSAKSGSVIGLTLAVVHILGIGLTGTSVNPARSLGPAIANAIFNSNSQALSEVWVFIVGPVIGAVLAAFFCKNVLQDKA